MINNPDFHFRCSIRLENYDYSQEGTYYLTICTYNRETIFGQIENGEMKLNAIGHLVQEEWLKSAKIRKEIELDEFIIMPNHIHALVTICRDDWQSLSSENHKGIGHLADAPKGPKKQSIGSMIVGFKSAITKRINEIKNSTNLQIWQRNYYEHIVRNEDELNQIRDYIINNPKNWDKDEDYIL
jgi:putative transposase